MLLSSGPSMACAAEVRSLRNALHELKKVWALGDFAFCALRNFDAHVVVAAAMVLGAVHEHLLRFPKIALIHVAKVRAVGRPELELVVGIRRQIELEVEARVAA